jgi:nicotinate-nucleotide adenylyltransferase
MGKRIGIFRGSFDPVHNGHICFALDAINSASLDGVYFVLESSPGHKHLLAPIDQRKMLIELACKDYPKLHLLNIDYVSSLISSLLPKLQKHFGNDQLAFLMGSDIAKTLHSWNDLEQLCNQNDLIVSLRNYDEAVSLNKYLAALAFKPKNIILLSSKLPRQSSKNIKQSLYSSNSSSGLDKTVLEFIKTHSLYKNRSSSDASQPYI